MLELDSTGALQDVYAAGGGLGRTAVAIDSVDGLAVNTVTGIVYVAASRFMVPGLLGSISASRIYVLEAVVPPSGAFGVSAVSAHSALLSGAANANGPIGPNAVRTSFRLEVSEDGTNWDTVIADSDLGNSTNAVGFSLRLTNLKAQTTYHSRLVLTKEFNLSVVVSGFSFMTPALRFGCGGIVADGLVG